MTRLERNAFDPKLHNLEAPGLAPLGRKKTIFVNVVYCESIVFEDKSSHREIALHFIEKQEHFKMFFCQELYLNLGIF